MIIDGLDWDDANIEHINRHLVIPTEVEDICFGKHIAYSGEKKRYLLYGQTDNGRYLKVVLERIYNNRFRPITAFDMSNSEKHTYRKKLGR